MAEPNILFEAEFDPKVRNYWLVSTTIALTIMVIGIPLLLIWWPLGLYLTGRYLDRIACTLTRRNLIVKKGMFVRTEKTIPLDKITDLGMIQGPLMRYFGLYSLSVETAGQSGAGALITLIGIVDAEDFRERVLDQRDRLNEKLAAEETPAPPGEDDALLREIRDTLHRIEGLLEKPAQSPES